MPALDGHVSAAAVLSWLARGKAYSRKTFHDEAAGWLRDNRAPELARTMFAKAAVGAGDSSMAPAGITVGAWSDAARTSSAFFRIWNDAAFIRLPFNARVGLVTGTAVGSTVPEGKSVPVSKVVLGNVLLSPTRVAALCVVTDSLLFAIDAAGQSVFNRELLSVISSAVDAAFIADISAGITPTASTSPLADLRALFAGVAADDMPRFYFIAHPTTCALASTLPTAKSGVAFAASGALGGELAAIPLLASTGAPVGNLYLVDAAAIAAAAEAPTVEASSAATIQMDTTPTMASDVPTGVASLVSMFQTNSVAILANCVYSVEKLRANAVAIVSGISTTTWPAV